MCFGGGGSSQAQAVTPAPAPPPAEPAPTEPDVGSARKREETDTFGSNGPTTRVDRSASGGVVGGSGLSI